MKTIFMIMIVALVAATHARAQSTGWPPWPLQLNWFSDESQNPDDQPDIYGPDGEPVPITSDWHAQILDAEDYMIYWEMDHDRPEGGRFWEFTGIPGTGFQTTFIPIRADGRSIITRLYNHRYPALATMFADVGRTNLDWGVWDDLPPFPEDYNFGKVSQSDWKIIPEPGAAGLLLVGAGALVFRRMKARAAG